ncbi:hypothetical protein [Mucilaginibacter sp. UYCu711]|uniref:hypothetical protein n=1 Tax=Mucilaginibacter sp. UYCu711 TaxID=3156339 RepID=UPI003D1A29B8
MKTLKQPSKIMREVKFLSREHRKGKEKLVIAKNQLHAREHAHGCPASVIKRLKKQIAFLEAQLLETEAELRVTVMSDSILTERKPAKKIGITAVARKLLILTYILWKNDTEFEPTYSESK